MGMLTLQTKRLSRRPITAEDGLQLSAWAMDCQATRFLGYDVLTSEEQLAAHAAALTEKTKQSAHDYVWLVHLTDSPAAIGQISLHSGDTPGRYVLGYEFSVSAWGKGYATEAAQAVIQFAFTQTPISFIYGTYDTENPASGGVLRHCGMQFLSQREGCDIKQGLTNRTMIRMYIERTDKEEG